MTAIVFAVEGEDGVWVADLASGSVKKIDVPEGKLADALALTDGGVSVVKGVKLAVAVKAADAAAAGHLDG